MSTRCTALLECSAASPLSLRCTLGADVLPVDSPGLRESHFYEPPTTTVREAIKRIEADGWVLVGQSGSHRQFKHPMKPGRVTIAGKLHKDLHPKTLRSILNQARLEDQ